MKKRYSQISNILNDTQAIVFDWDDTLVDTSAGKLAQNRDLARLYGVERTEAEVVGFYKSGLPLREMLMQLCKTTDFDGIWQQAKAQYDNPEYAKRTIEGAEQSVQTLRDLGYRTALFTALSPEALQKDVVQPGFDLDVFSTSPMYVPDGMRKSSGESFDEVIEWLGSVDVSPAQALYVGDGLGGMKGATSAGMKFIGVETGPVTASEFRERGALSLPGVQQLAMIAANRTPK